MRKMRQRRKTQGFNGLIDGVLQFQIYSCNRTRGVLIRPTTTAVSVSLVPVIAGSLFLHEQVISATRPRVRKFSAVLAQKADSSPWHSHPDKFAGYVYQTVPPWRRECHATDFLSCSHMRDTWRNCYFKIYASFCQQGAPLTFALFTCLERLLIFTRRGGELFWLCRFFLFLFLAISCVRVSFFCTSRCSALITCSFSTSLLFSNCFPLFVYIIFLPCLHSANVAFYFCFRKTRFVFFLDLFRVRLFVSLSLN